MRRQVRSLANKNQVSIQVLFVYYKFYVICDVQVPWEHCMGNRAGRWPSPPTESQVSQFVALVHLRKISKNKGCFFRHCSFNSRSTTLSWERIPTTSQLASFRESPARSLSPVVWCSTALGCRSTCGWASWRNNAGLATNGCCSKLTEAHRVSL